MDVRRSDKEATPRCAVVHDPLRNAASRRGISSRGGQGLLEYTILVVIVASSLVAVQTYVRRGLQARIKDAAYPEVDRGPAPQYDPYYIIGTGGVRSKVTANYTFSPGGNISGNAAVYAWSFCRNNGTECPSQTEGAPP